jgi:beta-glucosidase/6-phospho-beta-glucosidase/beta-galactosidase
MTTIERPGPQARRRSEFGPRHSNRFMFATGIESSCPVITGRNGRDERVDEMAKCGFYDRWREDFHLIRYDQELEFLRFGPDYHRCHLGPGKYDWSFCDETFAELKSLGITPICDLCHFGVPDWIGDFQNPDWPELFAEYATDFAKRLPWVRFYTPVNEIFINATFSAEFGWWNERLRSERAFVTSLKHQCRATILAEEAILSMEPDAMFVQSEATSFYHLRSPKALRRANTLNQRRFLSLDLCYGHEVGSGMYEFLMDNGMTREEYHWLIEHGKAVRRHCIMGNDYYFTNESLVPPEGPLIDTGEVFGYYIITKQYYDRYRLPVMHTETNLPEVDRAPGWLWKEWLNMVLLKHHGVPIIGFTWYSLTDQMDWDTALRENNGNVNPLGLYDLDRKIRPVGREYKALVHEWREILPLDSVCLSLHNNQDRL